MAANNVEYTSYTRWRPLETDDDTSVQGTLYLQRTPKTSRKYPSFWLFLMYLLIGCTLFTSGWLTGYLIMKGSVGTGTSDESLRQCVDKDDGYMKPDILKYVHENVMYSITGETVLNYYRLFQNHSTSSTLNEWNDHSVRVVKTSFEQLKVDRIDVKKYKIELKYPRRPNVLQILSSSGVLSTLDLGGLQSTLHGGPPPYVAGSLAGDVQGDLVYGNYGLSQDFNKLKDHGINLMETVALIRLGKTSVYQKLVNCRTNGVKAALLYWHPDDVSTGDHKSQQKSHVPYLSSYSPTNLHDDAHHGMMAASISANQAELLLSHIKSLVSLVTGNGDLTAVNATSHHSVNGSIKVRLVVNNTSVKTAIHNIIATIYGHMHPDQHIVLGASRSASPDLPITPHLGTSLLLAVAKSFTSEMANTNKDNAQHWRVQRTVKFISWGGAEFSHLGIRHHFQDMQTTFSRKTLAYFDLDNMVKGHGVFFITSPPSFHRLFSLLTKQVPAPDSEDRLHSLWEGPSGSHKLHVYPQPAHHYPVLSISAVPTITARFVSQQHAAPLHIYEVDLTAMDTSDSQHHFRYHVAATRLITLATLALTDHPYTTYYNPVHYVDYIYDLATNIFIVNHHSNDSTYNQLIEMCNACLSEMNDRAKHLHDVVVSLDPRHDGTKIQSVVDRIRLFERALLDTETDHGSFHILSGPIMHGNSSDIFSSLMMRIRSATSQEDWRRITGIMSRLLERLHEASGALMLSE